jgi:hypothetical protein
MIVALLIPFLAFVLACWPPSERERRAMEEMERRMMWGVPDWDREP